MFFFGATVLFSSRVLLVPEVASQYGYSFLCGCGCECGCGGCDCDKAMGIGIAPLIFSLEMVTLPQVRYTHVFFIFFYNTRARRESGSTEGGVGEGSCAGGDDRDSLRDRDRERDKDKEKSKSKDREREREESERKRPRVRPSLRAFAWGLPAPSFVFLPTYFPLCAFARGLPCFIINMFLNSDVRIWICVLLIQMTLGLNNRMINAPCFPLGWGAENDAGFYVSFFLSS